MNPKPHCLLPDSARISLQTHDAVVIIADSKRLRTKKLASDWHYMPAGLPERLVEFWQRSEFKSKPGAIMCFDLEVHVRIVLACLPEKNDAFGCLTLARQIMKPLQDARSKRILLELRPLESGHAQMAHAIIAAADAGDFQPPLYGQRKPGHPPIGAEVSVVARDGFGEQIQNEIQRAISLTKSTNMVRRLALMAGNDLTTKNFVEVARSEARKGGLATEFINQAKLQKLGAGAFLAVAQGSQAEAGILKISYVPVQVRSPKHLALVGKGITFDTGGSNIKTGESMYGMNGDMSGAAVALATILHAARQSWPIAVTSYLAIAENAISEKAYRPNDVVTTCDGQSIEVVNTDAEGRMVLADTLAICAKTKPDLIVDFATLTGACIRALGSRYSGVFTNRDQLIGMLIAAGQMSGERVWPFPIDADYGEPLESQIADVRQCTPGPGPDHIEAAVFLRRFVGDVPWVHCDLSSNEHEGGLAHVADKVNGFGVRFASQLSKSFFEF